MAPTSEERAALKQQAKEQVNLTPDELQLPAITGNKQPSSTPRVKTNAWMHLKGPGQDASVTVGAKGENEPITLASLVRSFHDQVRDPSFAHGHYTSDQKDFSRETDHLLKEYAAGLCKPDKIAFPFIPVTTLGKETWPKFDGLVDENAFANLIKHPDTLFQEMKVKSLMMMAYRQQAKDLHDLAVLSTRRVKILVDWAKEFGKIAVTEEKQLDRLMENNEERAAPDPRSKQTIDHLLRELETANTERNRVQGLLNETNQHVVDLLSRRGGTPGSIRTDGGTRKSAKISVPVFYNDKDKDDVKFEV
ncbi:hypothetical protein GGS24DRAFT_378030 [Hypoxylon argillaceum]|nr:hypothetical protein GGS24DRAFT_378030 [Hypoxylon argillaceum]